MAASMTAQLTMKYRASCSAIRCRAKAHSRVRVAYFQEKPKKGAAFVASPPPGSYEVARACMIRR
jgi:hypothetical protein